MRNDGRDGGIFKRSGIFGYADAGFSGGSVRIAAFVDFYVFPADTISYDHFTLYDLSS